MDREYHRDSVGDDITGYEADLIEIEDYAIWEA